MQKKYIFGKEKLLIFAIAIFMCLSTVNIVSAAPGDTCAEAVSVTPGSYNCPGMEYWYVYTPTSDGDCTVTSDVPGASVDTYLAIWDECGDAYPIDSQDDCWGVYYSYASEITFSVTTGEDYFIQWDDYYSWNTPGVAFDWDLIFTAAPPPSPGDDCSDPVTITIPADLPYSDTSQYTCGRGNDYDATCLGYYDGGEDIIYELTVTSNVVVDIQLDPKTTTYTGILIDDECPDTGTCIDYSTNSGASIHGMSTVSLTTGTYYIMVDTWPSPNCISDFDLTITEVTVVQGDTCADPFTASLGMNGLTDGTKNQWYEYTPSADCIITISSDVMGQGTDYDYDTTLYVYDACGGTQVAYDGDGGGAYTSTASFSATAGIAYKILWEDSYYPIPDFYWEITETFPSPGDDCSIPITITLPADLPYSDIGQYTCGRGNFYDGTCLGYYDGGEDIIYELIVTSDVTIDIQLDPKTTTWTGILIDDECPDTGTCIDYSTNSGASTHGITVSLTTGTYYIMVDTWPSPNCIPDFDLHISLPPPVAEANGDYFADETNDHKVQFDGSGSYAYSGTIVSYEWDFTGDGIYDWIGDAASNGQTEFQYPCAGGSYKITTHLRVTDSNGLTATDTATVFVTCADTIPPMIKLIYPEGGEHVSGIVTVEWIAVDHDYPGSQSIDMPIYLYYSPDDGKTWRQINDVLPNTGEYSWDTNSLSDGSYMLLIEALDKNMNVAHEQSKPFTIDTGYTGLKVTDVQITDTSINSRYWVKDGDDITITASITGGTYLNKEDITADLSGFGYSTQVIANDYDGFIATWRVTNAICTPSDGSISVRVTVDNAESNIASITADNTIPEITIIKPLNYLYFLNKRFLPLSQPLIIGPITIELNTYDSSGIEKAEFYIDNELEETVTKEPFRCYLNKKLKGEYKLDIIISDYAGNIESASKMLRFFNLFVFG